MSLGAGFPARGEIVMSGPSRHWARSRIPNFGGVLGNGAVAGEFAGSGNVQYRLARPLVSVGIEIAKPVIRLQVGFEVRQMHVVVAMRQQRLTYWSEDARFIAAEMIGGDQVQCGSGFRLIVVMPIRAVPAAAVRDLLRA